MTRGNYNDIEGRSRKLSMGLYLMSYGIMHKYIFLLVFMKNFSSCSRFLKELSIKFYIIEKCFYTLLCISERSVTKQ